MQKIIISFLFSIVFLLQVNAQKEAILNTISVFPYQQVKEADAAIQSMDAWKKSEWKTFVSILNDTCLLYTSPSPRDRTRYRMPSSA